MFLGQGCPSLPSFQLHPSLSSGPPHQNWMDSGAHLHLPHVHPLHKNQGALRDVTAVDIVYINMVSRPERWRLIEVHDSIILQSMLTGCVWFAHVYTLKLIVYPLLDSANMKSLIPHFVSLSFIYWALMSLAGIANVINKRLNCEHLVIVWRSLLLAIFDILLWFPEVDIP